jgi:ABC-2 type transport system permease protein
MAGAYIAIGTVMSALTPAQVVAFVLAVLVSFLLTALGLPLVSDFFSGVVGGGLAEAISRFSILHHFDAAQRGVVEVRSLLYFGSLIALCLAFTTLAVDARRGGAR